MASAGGHGFHFVTLLLETVRMDAEADRLVFTGLQTERRLRRIGLPARGKLKTHAAIGDAVKIAVQRRGKRELRRTQRHRSGPRMNAYRQSRRDDQRVLDRPEPLDPMDGLDDLTDLNRDAVVVKLCPSL